MPFLFIPFNHEDIIKKWMILCSIIALFIIGVIKGIYTKKIIKNISEIMVIGLIGVYISFNVAKYVKSNILNN